MASEEAENDQEIFRNQLLPMAATVGTCSAGNQRLFLREILINYFKIYAEQIEANEHKHKCPIIVVPEQLILTSPLTDNIMREYNFNLSADSNGFNLISRNKAMKSALQ